MTSHSAEGSAAGYLYQCERALLELLRRASDPRARLLLEAADDVEIQVTGQPSVALQVKHHAPSQERLSDSSVDFWRTMAVWLDQQDAVRSGDLAYLGLVSTRQVKADSGLSLLSVIARDPIEACRRIEQAAELSTNGETKAARDRFLELLVEAREQLLECVWVLPAEPGLLAINEELRRSLALHLTLATTKHEAFLESLKGWWYAQCVTMLTHHGASVGATDLTVYIQELRDSFHPDNLPTSYDLPDPTEAEIGGYDKAVFVEQLRWVAYTNEQLRIAIHDYHRAFTQRSQWSRQGLIYPGELERFEGRLVEQWRRAFADAVAELGAGAEEDRERAGRQLLQQLRDSSNVRLRDRYNEVFLTHGSLHGLANAGEVGWHPDFVVRLEALLKGAA